MGQVFSLPVQGTPARCSTAALVGVAALVTAPNPSVTPHIIPSSPRVHPLPGGLTTAATLPHSPPYVGQVFSLPVQGTPDAPLMLSPPPISPCPALDR